MRLFHSANGKTGLLQSMVGTSRYWDEAADAVGKPAAWLSSQPMLHSKYGLPYHYRYATEALDDDPDLNEDVSVRILGDTALGFFSRGSSASASGCCYLLRQVQFQAIERWSHAGARYVAVDKFEAK